VWVTGARLWSYFFSVFSLCVYCNASTLSLIPSTKKDFQLRFLFDLLSFSFPELQFYFFQNFHIFIEFLFNILCFICFIQQFIWVFSKFIQAFYSCSLIPLVILIIFFLKSLKFHPLCCQLLFVTVDLLSFGRVMLTFVHLRSGSWKF
jgi:Fe2+ transport system protein B